MVKHKTFTYWMKKNLKNIPNENLRKDAASSGVYNKTQKRMMQAEINRRIKSGQMRKSTKHRSSDWGFMW